MHWTDYTQVNQNRKKLVAVTRQIFVLNKILNPQTTNYSTIFPQSKISDQHIVSLNWNLQENKRLIFRPRVLSLKEARKAFPRIPRIVDATVRQKHSCENSKASSKIWVLRGGYLLLSLVDFWIVWRFLTVKGKRSTQIDLIDNVNTNVASLRGKD